MRIRRPKFRTPPEFIAWDGEGIRVESPMEYTLQHKEKIYSFYQWTEGGQMFENHVAKPQPYILLANSKGGRIINRTGLPTRDCLEYILAVKQQYQNSIFVGFGFNYDINQILKDLPVDCLERLHATNETRWMSYTIKWLPRKSLYIGNARSKRTAIIYDVFGYFQTSFLQVCRKYLGADDPQLAIIEQGKAARAEFDVEDLEKFIIPYNKVELQMLVRVMNKLREDFENAGIKPSRWHGPGAVAADTLKKFNVKVSREIPEGVKRAAQYAYAGGRFEQFRMGRCDAPIFEYDIRSAYPAAIAQLPDLSKGHWEYVKSFEPGTFGVWRIEYKSPHGLADNRPQPLFCRSQIGSISYPLKTLGWYWTPEADLVPDSVTEGYVFRPDTYSRPFATVEEMYEQRRLYKSQGISTERALKLILNSLYGKLAQTIGGKNGPPPWHQLEWAGYITSVTRAKIFQAIKQNPESIIATETDAVFSTSPLDLPLSDKLGEWELQQFKSIVYLQSGFYYADDGEDIICKYRGMDRDRETKQPIGLPYRTVLDHLHYQTGFSDRITPSLSSYTTRFIGLGLGLKTSAVWRSWEKKRKVIALDQNPRISKRFHLALHCDSCANGISMYQEMHPLLLGGYMGASHARALPWAPHKNDAEGLDIEEYIEEDPDFRFFGSEQDKWQ